MAGLQRLATIPKVSTSKSPLICAVALWLWAGAADAQDTVDLSIDQAGAVATQALLAGDVQFAYTIAEAILAELPDNRQALLVMAAAAPQLGDPARGRAAGRRAFRLSETDIQRYEAARLTALAAVAGQQFTLASFWLRRALNNAPNSDERTRTLIDARNVSRRNPISFQLTASLVPSSNINGGAEDEESTAPGNPTGTLSADSLALEGWRASLGFGARYRLHQTEKSRSAVGVTYQMGRARITEETTVPDEAFDTSYYGLSVHHDWALKMGVINLEGSIATYEYRDLDLGAGTTSYDKYDIRRLGLTRQIPLSAPLTLTLSGNQEWLTYSNPGIGEVDRTLWRVALTRRLANTNTLSGSFSLTQSFGDSVNYTYTQETLSLSYAWGELIGPFSLALAGGAKRSDYPDYQVLFTVPGGRQDTTYFLNANIGFPGLEYFGFSPGVRIDLSEDNSNVSRFDRTNMSVALTINSAI